MSDAEPDREPDQLPGVPLPEYSKGIVGHEAVSERLQSLLAGERLPGGFLLHGPRGIGKATLAFRLAGDILLRTGDEDEIRVREQIAALSHPNLFLLRLNPRDTGKGFYTTIRVDDVRDLKERLRMTRGRAGHRVAIVDSIDNCAAASANALLKVLEEPPPETLFILISHRPGQLLPTIRSRTQSVAMRPISDADVREVLAATMPSEAADRIETAVTFAGGRPRLGFEALAIEQGDALSLLRAWLADPQSQPAATRLALADAIAVDAAGAAARFARRQVIDWIAAEARAAALAGPDAKPRLASANALWENAQALFEDVDSINLDFRQTLVMILDAIDAHARQSALQTDPK